MKNTAKGFWDILWYNNYNESDSNALPSARLCEKGENSYMKYLTRFLSFNLPAFLEGKTIQYIGKETWRDFNSGEILGTKVKGLITRDETDYGNNAEPRANLYEKVVIKVPKELELPLNSAIMPLEATSTVFGDYRNQLSIVAKDIEIVNE